MYPGITTHMVSVPKSLLDSHQTVTAPGFLSGLSDRRVPAGARPGSLYHWNTLHPAMAEIGAGSYQRLIESTSQRIHSEGGTLELPEAPPALQQAFNLCLDATAGDPNSVDWQSLVLCSGSSIYQGYVVNTELKLHLQSLLQAQADAHERASLLTLRFHELGWQSRLAEQDQKIVELSTKLAEQTLYSDRWDFTYHFLINSNPEY